jgi:hypothetical protein
VLVQLVGEESFNTLARAFWHAAPPQRGDVGQWGDTLAGFLRASHQLAEEPYLADVAALEWLLHTCTSAVDRSMEASSFALLSAHDPADLHLCLAPGCATLVSAWPVASIINAHLDPSPSFDTVSQRLRDGVGEVAVVWRAGLRPRVREALKGELPFISQLLAGHTFGAALHQAPTLDISAWLPMAVQSGLLLGVHLAAKVPGHSNDVPAVEHPQRRK